MTEYITPQTKRLVDSLREFLRKQGRGKSCIRGGEVLFDKAQKAVLSKENARISVRVLGKAFKWLIDHNEITVKTWVADPGYPGKGNITLNLKPLPKTAFEVEWSKAVSQSRFSEDDRTILSKTEVARNFKGCSISFMIKILDCLYDFRENPAPAGVPLYNVSAQYFLGSSKVIDFLSTTTLASIGIDTTIYPGPYRYILVAGKPNPKSVILVENPHSFETAVQADRNLEHTWISAYGFGLSLDKDKDHGNMLKNSILDHRESLIPIVRDGSPDCLEKLWENSNIMFWGDLDQAGIQIYYNIKKSLPNLKLSALYKPMLDLLTKGEAHPYVKAVGKEGQGFFKGDRTGLEKILSACEEFAVDQESVGKNQIMQYAFRELTCICQPS